MLLCTRPCASHARERRAGQRAGTVLEALLFLLLLQLGILVLHDLSDLLRLREAVRIGVRLVDAGCRRSHLCEPVCARHSKPSAATTHVPARTAARRLPPHCRAAGSQDAAVRACVPGRRRGTGRSDSGERGARGAQEPVCWHCRSSSAHAPVAAPTHARWLRRPASALRPPGVPGVLRNGHYDESTY